MDHDIDKIKVEFHSRAQRAMFTVYQNLVHNLSAVNRQGNEGVYQQSISRYCSQFRQQLQHIVKDIMNGVGTNLDPIVLNRTLTFLCEDYERAFMQKIRSL